MKIYFNYKSFSELNNPFILTIGNFDGFHKGHLYIIDILKKVSSHLNVEKSVFTFVSKPSLIKTNLIKIRNILPFEDKIKIFEELGIDNLIIQEFDENFFNMERDDFLKIIISNKNLKGFILGENFRFGKDRKGDFDFLCNFIGKEKIKIKDFYPPANYKSDPKDKECIESNNCYILFKINLYFENSIFISSTYIRENIENGNLFVNKYLLYPFYIKGVVEEGKKIGRKIGFETANIYIYDQIPPKPGVYFTITEILKENSFFYSMTYVENNFQIETHIFDFAKNIYNLYIKVYFLKRLRNNIKINSINELKILLENDKKNIFDTYLMNNIPAKDFIKNYEKFINY